MSTPKASATLFLALALLLSGCSKDQGVEEPNSTNNNGSASSTAGTRPSSPTDGATSSSGGSAPDSTTGPNTVPESSPAGVNPLPPKSLNQDVKLMAGVSIRVSEVSKLELKGQGVGDGTGPGIAVSVVVSNRSNESFDFSQLSVTAQTANGIPLRPSRSEPASTPSTNVQPGQESTAIWTFHLDGAATTTLIQAAHPASPDVAQFRI